MDGVRSTVIYSVWGVRSVFDSVRMGCVRTWHADPEGGEEAMNPLVGHWLVK